MIKLFIGKEGQHLEDMVGVSFNNIQEAVETYDNLVENKDETDSVRLMIDLKDEVRVDNRLPF